MVFYAYMRLAQGRAHLLKALAHYFLETPKRSSLQHLRLPDWPCDLEMDRDGNLLSSQPPSLKVSF